VLADSLQKQEGWEPQARRPKRAPWRCYQPYAAAQRWPSTGIGSVSPCLRFGKGPRRSGNGKAAGASRGLGQLTGAFEQEGATKEATGLTIRESEKRRTLGS